MSQVNLDGYRKLVMLAGIASVSTAVLFIAIKFLVWLLSGSSVIFASLTDSMFDMLASLVNLLALRYSLTPPDKEHRFGHHKSQALASLAQAAFIGGSAALLIIHGVQRCINPEQVQHIGVALIVSIVSIVFTILLVLLQTYVYSKTKSESIAADRLHYLSDVSLNLGVIVSLVLSSFGYLFADGLFASVIGILIFRGAYEIGMKAVQILLDRSLNSHDMQKILQAIVSTDGVKDIHDLKTHRAGPMVYIQGHIVMDGAINLFDAHEIVSAAEKKIRADFADAEITLHMEPDNFETRTSVNFTDEI